MSAPPRGSRREIALVAGALLLPIPVLAGSGLTLPLPDAVERGIASLSPSALGSRQVPTRNPVSSVALGTRVVATGAVDFEEPVTPSGEAEIASPYRSATRSRGQTVSLAAAGSVGAADSPGGGGTSTAGAAPTADGEPTTDDSPPVGQPTPEAVDDEAVEGDAGSESGQPPLLGLVGTGQGISAGAVSAVADAADTGSAGISLPADALGSPSVEVGASPGGQPTGAGTGASIPGSVQIP